MTKSDMKKTKQNQMAHRKMLGTKKCGKLLRRNNKQNQQTKRNGSKNSYGPKLFQFFFRSNIMTPLIFSAFFSSSFSFSLFLFLLFYLFFLSFFLVSPSRMHPFRSSFYSSSPFAPFQVDSSVFPPSSFTSSSSTYPSFSLFLFLKVSLVNVEV